MNGQTEAWVCPTDGTLLTVERTGEIINTRHYGRREMLRYYHDGKPVKTCPGCDAQLHYSRLLGAK